MKEKGLVVASDFSVSNCKSKYETAEEETQALLEGVTEEVKVPYHNNFLTYFWHNNTLATLETKL